ncbi:hypothetical protein DN752_00800 [Echinicola strongylocentroti]|uniref:DUF4270 domain-containing protein n=1 Tax=Echinicola strongylocentroti TaxID=1795355 RepID=A0A2Z4IDE4_9BACT|nr:DUF4270 family protein [Echinicola strongylocentroti]AWW28785.1 hypothetical protein DN752_00800 [Echinicola strongylocentroti]
MLRKTPILLLLTTLLLTGCFENETLTESQVVVDGDELELQLIEYTDLNLFTYFNDSLVTNTLSSFMLGHHEDAYRGIIHAAPYLQFGLEYGIEIDDDAQLDSTVLVLFYENYHYDTLPEFDVSVYELTEELEENDDGDIYSYQSFGHQDLPMVSVASRIVPHKDSLTITLPATFSKELFELGKENDGVFASTENLEELFKGLMLSTNDNSALISFSDDSYIGFYYRIPSDLDEGAKSLKLTVNAGNQRFTHMDIDRSSSFFSSPNAYENIPRAHSGGVVMADLIMGASIRIELPNIHELLELADDYYITTASLRLPLKPDTYDRYFNTPITTINISVVDKKNLVIQQIGSTSLTSWDEQFQEKTFYEVPIKTFLDYKLAKGINNNDALWISIPASTSTIQTSGLILSDISGEQKIKIDITYLPLN